jgi:hypothetical protein
LSHGDVTELSLKLVAFPRPARVAGMATRAGLNGSVRGRETARERGLGTTWTIAYQREMAELLTIPYDTVVQAAPGIQHVKAGFVDEELSIRVGHGIDDRGGGQE